MISTLENIEVTIIVSDNCPECEELEIELKKISGLIKGINVNVVDRDYFNSKVKDTGFNVLITPALIINNRLITYGNPGNKKLENILLKHF